MFNSPVSPFVIKSLGTDKENRRVVVDCHSLRFTNFFGTSLNRSTSPAYAGIRDMLAMGFDIGNDVLDGFDLFSIFI
jgi:hypothetical protein